MPPKKKLPSSFLKPSDAESITRQIEESPLYVVDEVVSYAGSKYSHCGRLSLASQDARASLMTAKLDEIQLLRELELRNRLKIMRAGNAVERSRLHLDLIQSDEQDNSAGLVKSQIERAGLNRYLEECLKHAEPLREARLVHMPAKDAVFPTHVKMTPVETESDRGDLRGVCLSYSDGDPARYWKFMKHFHYYVEGER